MTAIIFHLHGKPAPSGVSIEVQSSDTLQQLRRTVAEKFNVALPATLSFHESADADTTPSDLRVLETVDLVLAERTVSLLISGKKVRPVPGPTGGLPFIGGYSEIYPDFMGNYQRLLRKYGHIVHVGYLGKGEFFSKRIGANHPLFPLKMTFANGLFTADSSDPEWSTSHKFMMTAMGARAMRNYVRTMDRTAIHLVKCFDELLARQKSFDAFPWGLRAAAQTIGEVGVGIDFKMLDNADSSVADVFVLLGLNFRLAQTLFRRGSIYRALPNPERRAQKATEHKLATFVDVQSSRVLQEGDSKDMPYQEAAVSTNSLLDYMLHATDEEGKKMDVGLVHSNVITFLAAGQVTTSSALSWLWFCLATFPVQARKLYASLIAAGLRADKEITAEELGKLEYLDWFVKETQRLYNPAFQPTREAQKDVIMPGGILVPKGAQVTVALHQLMVNPEHWKDPLAFDPDRWGTDEVRKRHKHAYIPFAAGGRGCIGFNFALQEIKIILSRVVLNFQIENTTEGAVIYDPDFSLFRPLNFTMKLHKQIDPSEIKVDVKPSVEEKIQAPQPSVGSKALPKFWAVHASNTGSCEGMAGDLAAKARHLGFADVQIVSLAESPLAAAKQTAEVGAGPNFFVICVATYNGEPPSAALDFSEMLDTEIRVGNDARFSGINYCVFGAGNTQWGPTYQAFPKKVDANMTALGGNRIFEKGSGDANADQDGDFTEWSTRLWAATAANFGIDVNAEASGSNMLTSSSGYTTDSVKVAFHPQQSSSAVDSSLSQPPIAEFVQATVRQNIELVDPDTPEPRAMRLIAFDIPDGFTYREGDHMEVFPENDPAVVSHLLVALDLVPDAVFTVTEVDASVNPKSLAALLRTRDPITLRELLTYYADLSGPLQRSSLQVLSSFLPGDDKFKTLKETLSIASAASDPEKENVFAKQNRNFAQLIANHPILAQALDTQKLLIILRATQPRRYSIASSPLVNSCVAKLCVGIEDSQIGDYEGLCSGFLKRVGVGHGVWVRSRASQDSFHLPTDPRIPVTMVAAGTGISPFLGFLEHRRAQGIKTQESGGQAPFRLFYGTRHHDMATLRAFVHEFIDDGTVVLEVAYSADDSPHRFAQQLLTRDGLKVWRDLSNNGHVYVCGSAARVGAGVRHSLMRIAEQIGGVADPELWLAGLRKEGRYSEDIFG
ncbi:cytochrome P450 [Mycena olivaceomarginata]|nr:cytochrome P450 [Mycena olivaceomarginata]